MQWFANLRLARAQLHISTTMALPSNHANRRHLPGNLWEDQLGHGSISFSVAWFSTRAPAPLQPQPSSFCCGHKRRISRSCNCKVCPIAGYSSLSHRNHRKLCCLLDKHRPAFSTCTAESGQPSRACLHALRLGQWMERRFDEQDAAPPSNHNNSQSKRRVLVFFSREKEALLATGSVFAVAAIFKRCHA